MFRDAFGLIVSEGALMNMFIRSHAGFKIEADKAKAILRRRRLSLATKPACGSRGPILIIGCSIARTPWCISPIIRVPPVSWQRR